MIFHYLAKEPFNVPPSEWGAMTAVQVKRVFLRTKEENDEALRGPPPESPKQIFYKIHQEWRGLPKEEVDALWEKARGQWSKVNGPPFRERSLPD